MTTFALYTFAYSAKLNGRSTSGTVQATNYSQALDLVTQSNELLSEIKVRVSTAGRKTIKSCTVG